MRDAMNCSQPKRGYVVPPGEPTKRMNLFTAINEALRIALEKDPSAVSSRRSLAPPACRRVFFHSVDAFV